MTKPEKLLRELIALPSVNPAFAPPRDPRAGEQRVADFLSEIAATSGLDVELHTVSSGRANLLVHLLPRGKVKHRVLLAPHMDTVPPATPDQLVPVTKNGRIYGRGACDTKGSVAAMFTALLRVAESGVRPRETEIVFAGLIDEENNQSGSRALAASRFKADLAIVGEPTELKVITAHKGDAWLGLITHGKAAHGARPELGRNAVLEMAKVVQLLETTYRERLNTRVNPLLGHATINVGSISGGSQPNIVPDRCEISVDRRTIPGETDATVRAEIRAILREHGLKADVANTKNSACLPMETDIQLPLVHQFLRTIGQKQPIGVHFFCDASVLSCGGIPSVVFGPGSIAQAHTTDEWVAVSQLEGATNKLTRFLRSLS